MELKSISKSFGGHEVLRDLSLSIPEGGRVMIYAPSGVGKTTLLRIMMGLETPDGGKMSDMPRTQAAVFQEDRLFDEFTPITSVKMTCPRTVGKPLIREHLEAVGLAGHLDKPIAQLSGGMRRRVAIVRAVLSRADTIYFDEPFTGLDEDTKRMVIDYILKNTIGKTLIFVSHCLDDAGLLNADVIKLRI